MKRKLLNFVCFLLLGSTLSAQAELYVGGQAGWNTPQDLTNIQGIGSTAGITVSDLTPESGVVFGAKFGGYFPKRLNWLGGEIEVYHTDVDINSQPLTLSAPIIGLTVSGTSANFELAVTTVAVNILARYPHKTLQPYIGIGGGLNIARFTSDTGINETAYVPTVNALAGLKFFVTEKIAVFGEYKFNYGNWQFIDFLEWNYMTHMFLGGVSYHFDANSLHLF